MVEGVLVLTAYRGAPTPHPIIAINKGICGAAVNENRTLNIPDVSLDPRYLSCDYRTRSEIVVPIRNKNGEAIGEIDIDSHLPNAFTESDQQKLEKLASELTSFLS
jgi:GAF domain-containing protein